MITIHVLAIFDGACIYYKRPYGVRQSMHVYAFTVDIANACIMDIIYAWAMAIVHERIIHNTCAACHMAIIETCAMRLHLWHGGI